MAAEDQIRDRKKSIPDSSETSPTPSPNTGGEQSGQFVLDGAYRKTFEKDLIIFSKPPKTLNDLARKIKETETALQQKATNGKKRGVDDLPTNLNGNRFPLDLKGPSIDSGLGDWRQTAKDFQYPGFESKSGFTKPLSVPVEISKLNFDPKKLKNESQPALERIKTRKQYYNLFDDYADKQFTHLLDYFSAQIGLGDLRPIPAGTYVNGQTIGPNTKDIYLGSFIKTLDDNEDPTMLGYDLKIRTADSPLFNGVVESFIKQFGDYGNSEIASRGGILAAFKEQFFKFFRTDSSFRPEFDGNDGVKAYYLKKLTGLNKLNDTSDSSESKQFVDYGKDFITLGFNEDVTQNAAYLASLYKALSYSRLNGKQILPENVLRFDVDVEITEIRKYKRVFKNIADNKLQFVADKISKYTYTLYECQFFFPNLPHNDSLDLSGAAAVEDFELKFNFKWSTLKFSKFYYNTENEIVINEFGLDNKYLNPTSLKPNSTNNNVIVDGAITSLPNTEIPKETGGVEIDTGAKIEPSTDKGGDLDPIKKADQSNGGEAKQPDDLVTDTTDSEVKPTLGNLGSVGSQISKSLNQSASDLIQQISKSNNFENLQKSLEGVKASTIAPSFKKFSQDILGGGIIKSDLINNIGGKNFNFDSISKALDGVKASVIAPSIKKFSQDILGGGLIKGDVLGAIGGKTLNFDSITKALDGVKAATIAPSIKKFSQDILGGSISKSSMNNEFISKATKSIVSQASLLNKTLSNISSVIPIAKPTTNDLTKKAQSFVGRSLKNFFQK